MIECPVCPDKPLATASVAKNCYRCGQCGELVFSVRNPYDPESAYPAIANLDCPTFDLPDDVMRGRILDQSSLAEPPRVFMLDIADGTAVLLLSPYAGLTRKHEPSRKSLAKPAAALRNHVLYSVVPSEVIDRVRKETGNTS